MGLYSSILDDDEKVQKDTVDSSMSCTASMEIIRTFFRKHHLLRTYVAKGDIWVYKNKRSRLPLELIVSEEHHFDWLKQKKVTEFVIRIDCSDSNFDVQDQLYKILDAHFPVTKTYKIQTVEQAKNIAEYYYSRIFMFNDLESFIKHYDF